MSSGGRPIGAAKGKPNQHHGLVPPPPPPRTLCTATPRQHSALIWFALQCSKSKTMYCELWR